MDFKIFIIKDVFQVKNWVIMVNKIENFPVAMEYFMH